MITLGKARAGYCAVHLDGEEIGEYYDAREIDGEGWQPSGALLDGPHGALIDWPAGLNLRETRKALKEYR